MDKMTTALKVSFIILNCALTALILKQDAKERGFGRRTSAPQARAAAAKRRTEEDMQVIATRVMIVLYAAAAIALLLLGR